MGFNAKIIADSISPAGIRLISMEVSYPRIIHAEMLRHRVFERCAASSRAIPVQRFVEQVMNDPYVPSTWGKNQKGMQAGADLDLEVSAVCAKEWLKGRDHAVDQAMRLLELGVHKQLTNRLLEPFQWMTEIITATEWDNFYHLRVHPDAHPDIQRVAKLTCAASDTSKPTYVGYNDWHLPYLDDDDYLAFNDADPACLPSKERPLASIGRAARASYLKLDDPSDLAKDVARSNDMLAKGHMSPFGHAARPMTMYEVRTHARFEVKTSSGNVTSIQCPPDEPPVVGDKMVIYGGDPHETIVEVGGWKAFCGSFNGWVQYRKTIPGEADILGARK